MVAGWDVQLVASMAALLGSQMAGMWVAMTVAASAD